MRKQKVMIFGAGVIGSLYAVKFAEAGHNVTVYARGERLKFLREKGLLYQSHNTVKRADVKVMERPNETDDYDFVFLTVRNDQIYDALTECNNINTSTIVTMVNTARDQREWEKFCGGGKIIPAFPGACGKIRNGILEAALTPWLIQPTTFGEFAGKQTDRSKRLTELFRSARIPYQRVRDMHAWQISHLGLVVPLADAYYMTDYPEAVYTDSEVMEMTSRELKANMHTIHSTGMLSPVKFHIIRICPVFLTKKILEAVYRSSFAEKFMYPHAIKARQEMQVLHEELGNYISITRNHR